MAGKKSLYDGTIFDLSGKVALVSGGAGLLGREFCKALGGAGAAVILADNNQKAISRAETDVRKCVDGVTLSTMQLDVTDESAIDKCIDAIMGEFGHIDVLVNSAAVDPKFDKSSGADGFSSFTEFKKDMWRESIDVNLTGMFLLTQRVCRVMEQGGKGSIINLGSNYGLVGPDQRIYKKKGQNDQLYKPAVYSVCKAGIIGFTKYLAAYYAGTEIRVNVLTPSGVYNDHDKEFEENYASRTILGRMSAKDEFSGGLLFLASDASSYMTGGNLVIDGGWTAI